MDQPAQDAAATSRSPPSDPGAIESFRSSFWWLLTYVLLVGTSIGVPIGVTLVMCLDSRPLPSRLAVAGICAVVAVAVADVFAVLALPGLVLYFKVYVGARGLRAYDSWCLYHSTEWAAIQSARPVNILGLRYLRLRVAGFSGSLWIPLYLSDMERFCLVVRQHAGADHLLARALSDELTAS